MKCLTQLSTLSTTNLNTDGNLHHDHKINQQQAFETHSWNLEKSRVGTRSNLNPDVSRELNPKHLYQFTIRYMLSIRNDLAQSDRADQIMLKRRTDDV